MTKTPDLKRNDLIYPELCYQIIGGLFRVWGNLGPGHKEKIYQKAVYQELTNADLKVERELPSKLYYQERYLGIYYFDFLIEGKLVLETKVRNFFSRKDIEQVLSYLKSKNLKLGIIAHFTKTRVKFKRIVNLEK